MRRIDARALLAAMAGLLFILAVWFYAMGWTPSRDKYPVQGVAITSDAGDVQWPTAQSAGVDFAYLRATYGVTGRDAGFATYWANSRTAKVRRGAWHAYSLCQSADAQANNFVAAVPREKVALAPAIRLDFMDDCPARPGKAAVLDEIRLLVKAVEQQSGKPAILWISANFDDVYGVSAEIKRELWLDNGFFQPNYGARGWAIWRASDRRRVDGMQGSVAWNVVHPH
ncbi:GH25 family lysozyme [Aquisediminimonas sediminicola]|uniref:GH25 family lysozyme n=1 Tax=Alteraquisediminimonas sediminicola TaxID=2676787 RepID=UPI001C8E28D5|nr:GH25 family lysozyme [Aquisediminimonas sediminicola]